MESGAPDEAVGDVPEEEEIGEDDSDDGTDDDATDGRRALAPPGTPGVDAPPSGKAAWPTRRPPLGGGTGLLNMALSSL